MGIKALFTYDYGKEKMKSVEDLGYDIIISNEKDLKFSEELEDIEAMICYNPFETLDITKMKKLKWIQLSSIGIDQLPMGYLKNTDITVTNNKGGYSIPMGEWIVMKILELLKHSFNLYKNQINNIWKMDTGILELYRKKVAFIGTGSIAAEAAKRLQGFEVEILGVNTNGRTIKYFDKCYAMDEINAVLSEADIVVITLPSTNETYHFFDRTRLSVMKKGAFLVNVARGNIIDEAELAEYLEDNRIRGAALDVFEEEPLPGESPLWKLNNVIITPHNSWISEKRNERRWDIIMSNLGKFSKNEDLINIVNLHKGY